MLRIHASTMSESDVTFQIGVFADKQFRLKYANFKFLIERYESSFLFSFLFCFGCCYCRLGERYRVRATVSEQRFYRFDFPDGMSDDAVLDVRSDAPDSRNICATIFVLDSQVIGKLP